MGDLVASHRGTNNYFVGYILQRLERNKNFLVAICGPTGSGKSYSALRLAELIDKSFTAERVVFTTRDFMRVLNSGTLKRGNVIVYDEAGVGVSAAEWQSMQNKLFGYILQTFRHKNLVVIFTTPHLGFLTKTSRTLLHCYCETEGIDYKAKTVSLKPLLLQTSQRTGDTYYKYLRVVIPDEGVQPIVGLDVLMPSKPLIAAYEEKKNAFTAELNDSIEKDLAESEAQDSGSPLTEKQEAVLNRLKAGEVPSAIAVSLGITRKAVYDHIQWMKKKGYGLKPVKDGSRILRYDVEEPSQ